MLLPESTLPLLLAQIAGSVIGFPVSAVAGIHRAVAISDLPGAPEIIEGVVNLRGRIVPVVDVRRLLGIESAALSPEQFMVVLAIAERLIAVRVDDVHDVTEVSGSSLKAPKAVSPVLERLKGVAATEDGAVVVYDVEAFLTQAETEAIDLAIARKS